MKKEKRAGLSQRILSKEEKEKSGRINSCHKMAFSNRQKEKRAELVPLKECSQNEEKEKRAAELIVANKELAFQNNEKEKRAAELVVANKELAFQNDEKENGKEHLP